MTDKLGAKTHHTDRKKKRYFFLAWERNIVYNGNRKDAVTTVPAP